MNHTVHNVVYGEALLAHTIAHNMKQQSTADAYEMPYVKFT